MSPFPHKSSWRSAKLIEHKDKFNLYGFRCERRGVYRIFWWEFLLENEHLENREEEGETLRGVGEEYVVRTRDE
jgi:hypothetical protein